MVSVRLIGSPVGTLNGGLQNKRRADLRFGAMNGPDR
jgi:hypothetical protein